jgi:DNA-binding NarL/FixJ family response regulator
MASGYDGRKLSVWVVEDDRSFRNAVAELIDQAEDLANCNAFESCEQAIAAMEKEEAPDVILMDIGLPGMNGIEGLKRIKSVSPGTEVLMLTIHEKNDTIFEAICAGASGYLLKSSPSSKIIDAIRDVYDGGASINAQIARKVLDMFARLNVPKENYGLTAREKDILRHMVEGATMRQIADRLFLSYHTIDAHTKNIYLKLQVHTRSGAVAKVLKEHLI